MPHHRRGRPKNARAGCLQCKPHKANGAKGSLAFQPRDEQVARQDEAEAREDLARDPHRRTLDDEALTRALSWERFPRIENDRAMREKERRRAIDGR